MLLNIYDEKRPAEIPVRLTLRENMGDVVLMIVDEDGLELHSIITISNCSNDIFLHTDIDGEYGFKLDDKGRIKVRKEKPNDQS